MNHISRTFIHKHWGVHLFRFGTEWGWQYGLYQPISEGIFPIINSKKFPTFQDAILSCLDSIEPIVNNAVETMQKGGWWKTGEDSYEIDTWTFSVEVVRNKFYPGWNISMSPHKLNHPVSLEKIPFGFESFIGAEHAKHETALLFMEYMSNLMASMVRQLEEFSHENH